MLPELLLTRRFVAMRRMQDVEQDGYSLEVFECNCGFHLGIDATYLEAVDDVEIPCPNCKEIINTAELT
jgi:hypothetical protein